MAFMQQTTNFTKHSFFKLVTLNHNVLMQRKLEHVMFLPLAGFDVWLGQMILPF